MDNDGLSILSAIFGWLYFLSWSASFYPQVVLNYQRKSVKGLSLDFQAANVTGFAFYSVYTLAAYLFQPRLSVAVNDVCFALHALLLTLITLYQAYLYHPLHKLKDRQRARILFQERKQQQQQQQRQHNYDALSNTSNSTTPPSTTTPSSLSSSSLSSSSSTTTTITAVTTALTSSAHSTPKSNNNNNNNDNNSMNALFEIDLYKMDIDIDADPSFPFNSPSHSPLSTDSLSNKLYYFGDSAPSDSAPTSTSISPSTSVFAALIRSIHPFLLLLIMLLWSIALYNVALSMTGHLPWTNNNYDDNVDNDDENQNNFNTLQYFGYGKLIITFVKYTPQAYLNWKRKSTVGWSVLNVLLDITGGVFSVVQQFLDGVRSSDYSVVYGNIPKFLLAIETISFDLAFIIQHYVLYRKTRTTTTDEHNQTIRRKPFRSRDDCS